MADITLVLQRLARIQSACRSRTVRDPEGGAVVSAHQATLLSHLDHVDPTMVGELAGHMGVTASTMSLTLKRLEEAGLVRRDRDPADRRVVNVRLTEPGVRLRDAHSPLDPDRVHRMLLEVPLQRRAEALEGLALLADGADALIRRRREDVEAQMGGNTGAAGPAGAAGR